MTDEMLQAADRRIYLPMCACACAAPAPAAPYTPPPHAPLAPPLPSVGAGGKGEREGRGRGRGRERVRLPVWPAQVWLHRVLQPLGRRRARPAAAARRRARVPREAARYVGNRAAQTSASWLSGGRFQRRLLRADQAASGCPELRPSSAYQPLRPRWPAVIGFGFHTGCPRKRWIACVDRGTAASRDRTPRAKSLRASRTWVERSPSATRGGRKTSGTRDAGLPSRLPRNRCWLRGYGYGRTGSPRFFAKKPSHASRIPGAALRIGRGLDRAGRVWTCVALSYRAPMGMHFMHSRLKYGFMSLLYGFN